MLVISMIHTISQNLNKNRQKLQLKMFNQTHCTQAAEITPSSDGMVPSAAEWRYLQRALSIPSLPGGDESAQCIFCPWWPWPLTLTFKFVQARDQACLPCEFGANPFSGSRDIWFTNKQTINKTRAKDVLPNKPHAARRNHPTAAMEWCHLLPNDVICSKRVPFRRCWGGGDGSA